MSAANAKEAPDSTAGERWYVLYTMPQHEKKIAQGLEKKGIAFYLPLVARKRRWSDRWKIIDMPLFPGYVFVFCDWNDRHVEILRIAGAVNFIRNEKGGPAVMDGEELENLRLLVNGGGDLDGASDENYPPGQDVVIRFGPLQGVRGVVARVRDKNRLYVRVPLLNQMVSAEIDIMDVERID